MEIILTFLTIWSAIGLIVMMEWEHWNGQYFGHYSQEFLCMIMLCGPLVWILHLICILRDRDHK